MDEGRPESDVHDVAALYMIDPVDRDLAQQLRSVSWMRLTRPWLWPYRLNAHQPHQSLHPLPRAGRERVAAIR